MHRAGIAALLLLIGADLKPVVTQRTLTISPPDFETLCRDADDIVVLRITRSTVFAEPSSSPMFLPRVYTRHTADVLRTLKGELRAGRVVEFRQSTGVLELDDKIIEVQGRQPLAAERTYVVFLRRLEDDLILAYESDGAFEIVDGNVAPRGHSVVAAQQKGISESAFLHRIEHAD